MDGVLSLAGTARGVDRDEVAWFLLTSSNLSRSAWGFLDKVRSYVTFGSTTSSEHTATGSLHRALCTSALSYVRQVVVAVESARRFRRGGFCGDELVYISLYSIYFRWR